MSKKKLNDVEWFKEHGNINYYHPDNIKTAKELLDSTGCGFCLAKFKQVTMHLGTGMTHSCHHPVPHKIPLSEIENNPAALFNTSVLKKARTEMLNDKKPAECDYCWRVEDGGEISDRIYKSLETWAISDYDKISQLTGQENLNPSYLEVSFSNACNLSCVYCGPEFSSKWVEELKHHGPLKILEGTKDERWVQGWQDLETLSYKNREFNPYIDAFWKWFPEIYPTLKHYRITGGEPLLSKETFRSLDWFIDNPNLDLEFSINSNLSVPDKVWNKFIEKLKILKNGKVKKITVFTSAEGWGERAEYARTHMDFSLFKDRVEEILKIGNIRCVVMSAFNILSISSFQELLEWVLYLKRKYNPNNSNQHIETSTGFQLEDYSLTDRKSNNPDHSFVVGIDIPYLRHPEFLDIKYCSHDLVEKFLLPTMKFMSEHVSNHEWTDHQGFEAYEFDKLKRIVSHRLYFNRKNHPERDDGFDIIRHRAMFYEFIQGIDKRRGTDFLSVYPEYKEFYEITEKCRDIYLKKGDIV